jgi:uncharacterized protein with PIN domain
MICPQCQAEYRPGFTRCADCDVELAQSYVEAVRHPLAKKVAVSQKYGTRLWRGSNPFFYVNLLWSLWEKKIPSYGVPENLPIPKSIAEPLPAVSEIGGFEVWISARNMGLAKWILDSLNEEFEKNSPAQSSTRAEQSVREVDADTVSLCPLCFAEFTAPFTHCPNCGVPLRSSQPDTDAGDWGKRLCNFAHPQFIMELRRALQAAGIPFNNASFSSGDIFSGRYRIPNYEVVVLDRDFGRATQVMSRVLQHWEFEPSAGFGIGDDPQLDYWPVRAAENNWLSEDISTLVWSSPNIVSLDKIGMALKEHEIPYRVETEQLGTAKIFSHPEDEARAREIVREVVEGAPPE